MPAAKKFPSSSLSVSLFPLLLLLSVQNKSRNTGVEILATQAKFSSFYYQDMYCIIPISFLDYYTASILIANSLLPTDMSEIV